MKRTLPALMAFLLLAASAAQAQYSYTTNGGSITITGYSGPGGDVNIPTNINGLPVTTIAASAVFDVRATTLTIPESVTNIEPGAFDSCDLSGIEVDAQNPVYSSVNGVLFDKSQGTLVRYPPFTPGGNYTVPCNVTNIAADAFYFSFGLARLNFEGNAPTVGSDAFFDDHATVYYMAGTTGWSSTLGGLLTTPWIPFDYSVSGGSITITNYLGAGGEVTIPGIINGLPVTSIGPYAFFDTGVSAVTIPASVTSLGSNSFASCVHLTGVYFQGDAPAADSSVFFMFNNNTTVYYLPGTTGWSSTFAGLPAVIWNPLTPAGDYSYTTNAGAITITGYSGPGGAITIPPNTIDGLFVTGIGPNAFQTRSNLTSVTIPLGVTSIGDSAFESCANLTNAMIPNGVSIIGTNAFAGSGLTSVTYFGAFAFASCANLTNATIASGVTVLGDNAFSSCYNLTNVAISDTVSTMGNNAFFGCTRLASVTIPASVTAIGEGTFQFCTNLASIYFQGNAPTTDTTAFYSDTQATAYYLSGAIGWSSTFGGVPSVLLNPMVPPGDYMYSIDGGDITITGYSGPGGVVAIPATIDGLPVRVIGSFAFASTSVVSHYCLY